MELLGFFPSSVDRAWQGLKGSENGTQNRGFSWDAARTVPLGYCHPTRGCCWSHEEGQRQERVQPGDLNASATLLTIHQCQQLRPLSLGSPATEATRQREGELCPQISMEDHGRTCHCLCFCLFFHGCPACSRRKLLYN